MSTNQDLIAAIEGELQMLSEQQTSAERVLRGPCGDQLRALLTTEVAEMQNRIQTARNLLQSLSAAGSAVAAGTQAATTVAKAMSSPHDAVTGSPQQKAPPSTPVKGAPAVPPPVEPPPKLPSFPPLPAEPQYAQKAPNAPGSPFPLGG